MLPECFLSQEVKIFWDDLNTCSYQERQKDLKRRLFIIETTMEILKLTRKLSKFS